MSAQIDYLWVLLSTILIGAVILTFAVYVVISSRRELAERKVAETALQKSEEKYRQLFATVADAIVIYDAHTWQFIDVNQRAVELYGYTREEFLQMIQLDISAEPEASELSIKETLAGYCEHILLQYHKRKDGTVFPVEISRGVYTFGEQEVVCGVIRDITERKQTSDELRESREQLRSLSAHLQSVREESQKLLAREIHDELGQALTALKMDLSWLKGKLRPDQKFIQEKAAAMTELSDAMIQTVKRITARLRPALLDDMGAAAALEWELEEFAKRTGIGCDLTVEPEEIDLDQDRSTAVYRIFQEALTNIARHAQATNVKVSIKVHTGTLEMEIRDNGIGITKEQVASPRSFGLIGIRERVLQWDGEATIEGRKGKGTTLAVTIPLDNGGGPK
ncbi:MAG: PAS domain S-box protein [Planctomycetes bacterium]|nr:PAS domain S-box protein [Planctomycetota bacterium]